jgi:hypothetical protein
MTPLRFPDGKRFAFTIIDDTDVATVANIAPVYVLLERLKLRTTKTVWPLRCPEGGGDFADSQTLEDPLYREFVVDLQRRGFEIASHGATMQSSTRERTRRGLELMRSTFGQYPAVHANHAANRENLYWGTARVDHPVIRAIYKRTLRSPDEFDGHVATSPYWWGDLAQSHVRYVRNLTFERLNVMSINPTLPYQDPRRPLVNWWFSAADAENCAAFNHLLRSGAQDELEREGGVAIVATHFGKGFVREGRVDLETERVLEELSRRPGWFVPVGTLLDWLREHGTAGRVPATEWSRMQWYWLRDLVRRALIDQARRFTRRSV